MGGTPPESPPGGWRPAGLTSAPLLYPGTTYPPVREFLDLQTAVDRVIESLRGALLHDTDSPTGAARMAEEVALACDVLEKAREAGQ